jgi:hypothetical protein
MVRYAYNQQMIPPALFVHVLIRPTGHLWCIESRDGKGIFG